jgi:hypothetical protein
MAIAFLSFVVDSHYLNQTLHLSRGIKRLALLVAYVTLFVIVASGVRRSEVRAFLRYTLGLAVIAAFGTLVEYRFKYNVFYSLAHSLPGFHVSGQTFSSGVDDIGRRLVEGPADVPLEAVGMFAMALPIALAGLAEAKCWRPRITYGLAAALLLAASVSTERKSGLIGPAAVLLTFAVLRRRQAIRLLPLGALLVLVIHVAAPGALGGVSKQLAPSRLSVATVDVRVIRYDASRPDAWTHLALGQGYGTYDVRVLDNELLDRLLEGGVLGLGAYLLMLLAVMGVAFARARSRDPDDAMIGLVALSAAAGVLVLSATFDAMGFPHGPYIFLSLAGLLAAAVGGRRPAPEAETGPESRAASIGRASVPLSSSHPLRPPLRPVPVHGAVR